MCSPFPFLLLVLLSRDHQKEQEHYKKYIKCYLTDYPFSRSDTDLLIMREFFYAPYIPNNISLSAFRLEIFLMCRTIQS